jgi:hypothetical protein
VAGINNLPGYTNPELVEVLEALGNTKFSGTSSENWVHIINGLIIQGGKTPLHSGGGGWADQTVLFNAAFTKQVLGIFICPIDATYYNYYVTAVTLEQFNFGKGTSSNVQAYWFAIGV